MGKISAAILLSGSIFLVSFVGEASLPKGLFRLGLETTVFRFSIVNYDLDGPAKNDFRNVTIGAGLPMAGLNFAGTVANGLVFGGRVAVGRASDDQFFEDDHYLLWSIMPYLEYVFLNRVFRPFVTVMGGVEGVANHRRDDRFWWGLHGAGGGGAHFFVRRNISIDVNLLAGFIGGWGERDRRTKFKHWRFYTSILFGLSGWF